MTHRDVVNRWLLLAGTLCAGLFWYCTASTARLEASYRVMRAQKPTSYLMSGYRVSIDPATITTQGPPLVPSQKGRTLILSSSDTCPACAKEVSQWQALVSSLSFAPTDSVWLISYEGGVALEPIERVLRERGIPTRVAVLKDAITFSIRTGMNQTPMTVVLDSGSRARVVSRALTPEAHRLIAGVFGRGTS